MNIKITDKKIINLLLLTTALLFPLFSVDFLRFNIIFDDAHISPPMITIGIIIMMFFLRILMQKKIKKTNIFKNRYWKILFYLIITFFLLHVMGLFRSSSHLIAISIITKLTMGIAAFLCIILFFPSDKKTIKKFWVIIVWSSTALLLFLIYKYAFVFKSTYLSSQLDYATRVGRNQLAWYLIFVFPPALCYFWCSSKRKKIIKFIPLFVITISIIYSCSRSTWVSIVVSLFFFLMVAKKNKKYERKNNIIFLLLMSLLVLTSYWGLTKVINNVEISQRVTSLLSTNEVSRLHSYDTRSSLLKNGINYFINRPILGIGLGNSEEKLGRPTHNDYLNIFLEMGFLCGVCFIGILISIIKITKLNHLSHYKTKKLSWTSTSGRMTLVALCVSLFFINAYTTLLFWIFLGLILKMTESEKKYFKIS